MIDGNEQAMIDHQEGQIAASDEKFQQKVFEYLVELRDSGATNMFGACPYIERRFGIPTQEARKHLSDWMDSFK